MRPREAMHGYQKKAVAKIVAERQVAAFFNMGLGKTICALTGLVDLKAFPALVVAPEKVARNVWHREAAAWAHTSKLNVVPLVGTPAKRLKLLAEGADIFTVSYENLIWLMEVVDCNTFFKAVVWDELSKMKHAGSRRFKLARHRMEEIPIRIGLTGTPQGNHLQDVWGEMFVVAGEKPLGPSFVSFQVRYFHAIPTGIPNVCIHEPIFGAQEMIHEAIKPWCFSLDPADAPPMPELKTNIIEVDLPPEVQKLSEQLERELQIELASGKELIALSAGALAAKVRQMASGAVYTKTLNSRGGKAFTLKDRQEWEEVHTAKLDALSEVIDEMQGEPVLCVYWFKHERERILKRFKQAADLDIDRWNSRKQEVALIHPASAGHGLNLQFGGHNLVYFNLPWSAEWLQQTDGRLVRQGQKSPFVMRTILLAGPADAYVLSALRKKEAGQRALLDTVRLK